MEFHGEDDRDGCMSALDSYPAPPGPDWGWRIVLDADAESGIRILMYNITPDGDEALAVEAQYTLSAAAQKRRRRPLAAARAAAGPSKLRASGSLPLHLPVIPASAKTLPNSDLAAF